MHSRIGWVGACIFRCSLLGGRPLQRYEIGDIDRSGIEGAQILEAVYTIAYMLLLFSVPR
jgi:hypothetical protein